MHISNRGVVFFASVVFFTSILLIYCFWGKENYVAHQTSIVRFKIKNPQQEETAVHAYKVVYDNQKRMAGRIGDYMAGIKKLSYEHKDFESRVIAYLRSTIDDSDLAARDYGFFIDFREYIFTRFPENGKVKLFTLIDKSFININNDIKDLYGKMERFETWFERNKNLFAAMTADEIRDVLGQKRLEVFGKDAARIWNLESEEFHSQDLISVFNDASHIYLEDKALVFADAWDEMGAKDGPHVSEKLRKFQSNFLNMDSVQMALGGMDASKRAESLGTIRNLMGYDDAKIEEMKRFDAHQDRLWNNGQFYMAERQYILDKYSGIDREKQLNVLRQRYFKDEAAIIATEEASDIFRFKRKRIYGHR